MNDMKVLPSIDNLCEATSTSDDSNNSNDLLFMNLSHTKNDDILFKKRQQDDARKRNYLKQAHLLKLQQHESVYRRNFEESSPPPPDKLMRNTSIIAVPCLTMSMVAGKRHRPGLKNKDDEKPVLDLLVDHRIDANVERHMSLGRKSRSSLDSDDEDEDAEHDSRISADYCIDSQMRKYDSVHQPRLVNSSKFKLNETTTVGVNPRLMCLDTIQDSDTKPCWLSSASDQRKRLKSIHENCTHFYCEHSKKRDENCYQFLSSRNPTRDGSNNYDEPKLSLSNDDSYFKDVEQIVPLTELRSSSTTSFGFVSGLCYEPFSNSESPLVPLTELRSTSTTSSEFGFESRCKSKVSSNDQILRMMMMM